MRLRELAAQEARRVLQAARGLLDLRLVAEQREEHLGVRLVGAHLDVGDREQADARILQLEPDELRELALDLLGDAAAAGIVFGHDRGQGRG